MLLTYLLVTADEVVEIIIGWSGGRALILWRLEFVFRRPRGTGFPELWVGCVARALESRQVLPEAGLLQLTRHNAAIR